MRVMSLIAGAGGACLLMAAAIAQSPELPPGPNRDLVYGTCQTCHDLQYLKESKGLTRDGWNDVLSSMKNYGLDLTADRRTKILDYLATYLGPKPAPAAAATQTATPSKADGATVFNEQCAACHQPQGQGVAGQFPPLAGNRDLFLGSDFPVKVVLYGMSGEITAKGQSVTGAMPPFGHLSDTQIAAVVNYVRGAWGNAALKPNGTKDIDAATVAAARKQTMTSDAVFALRRRLKAVH
jgi:mono/diheme cytochrome c family protein